jgi:hypothetical protein
MTWVAVGAVTTAPVVDDERALGQRAFPPYAFAWGDEAEIHRRVKAFAAQVPDYFTVMNSRDWRRVTEHMNAYFHVSRNGPEVAYYLVHHQEIYDAIIAAPPVDAVAKLLSLERKLAECRQLRVSPRILYSTPVPIAPTPEESEAAMRLLYLVTWAHGEVGAANSN